MTALLDLHAGTYVPHRMHAAERTWTETNCYVDVWVEVLHALGHDPIAACAFTLSTDFEGDQWTFFKFPPEDLRRLYGIEVGEMNVWRPVLDHVVEQLELGRLLTVEVDAWHLPDTAGVSYGTDHVKTTIVPNEVDPSARRLGYFHNAGYHELSGADFDGLFAPPALPPYVELVRLERLRATEPALDEVVALTAEHLARRPNDNPMVRFRKRVIDDLPELASGDLDRFHAYAFGTCRQCGANAEVASSFVEWLGHAGVDGLVPARDALASVAESSKTLQLTLARAARGRAVDLDALFDQLAAGWDTAMTTLAERCGG